MLVRVARSLTTLIPFQLNVNFITDICVYIVSLPTMPINHNQPILY